MYAEVRFLFGAHSEQRPGRTPLAKPLSTRLATVGQLSRVTVALQIKIIALVS